MDTIIGTIELALIIVLPLIIFYQKLNRSIKIYAPYVALLYLLWFFSYALLHELCHMFGSWITGAKIIDYQLFPKYLEGDFSNAFVKSEFKNSLQLFVSPASPYLRDLVFICTGYLIFRRKNLSGSFMEGLLLVLLILSPVYDVFNNYFAFILGARNDFSTICKTTGSFVTHAMGLLIIFAGIFILWDLFARIKNLQIFDT
jgi:hypothetical protein